MRSRIASIATVAALAACLVVGVGIQPARAYVPVACNDTPGRETPPVTASVGSLSVYLQSEYGTLIHEGDLIAGQRICVRVTDPFGGEVVGVDLAYGVRLADPNPGSVGNTVRIEFCGVPTEVSCSTPVGQTGIEVGNIGPAPSGMTGVSLSNTCVFVLGTGYGSCGPTLAVVGVSLSDLPSGGIAGCIASIASTCVIPQPYVSAGQGPTDTVYIEIAGVPIRVNVPPICELDGTPPC